MVLIVRGVRGKRIVTMMRMMMMVRTILMMMMMMMVVLSQVNGKYPGLNKVNL